MKPKRRRARPPQSVWDTFKVGDQEPNGRDHDAARRECSPGGSLRERERLLPSTSAVRNGERNVSPVLHALGPIPSTLVTLDFETYYSADYSLSKLTTEAYVRDSRFEVIGVGVKVGNRPSVWMEAHDFRVWAAGVPWKSVAVLAHHAHFDGFVLSHHYGVHPGFWYDTLSTARALHGSFKGNDLGSLAEKYGVGRKGHEVHDAKGKRRRDFTPAEWLAYGAYCNNDNELARRLLDQMRPQLPAEELWLIDTTVRMFTEPSFVADQEVLALALAGERKRKAELLRRIATAAGQDVPDGSAEDVIARALEACRATLSSSDKFAALLRSLGEAPPMKQGKNCTIYAFAKSDPGMQALLEHPREELQHLAEARLAVKSTIVETRTERLAGVGRRGSVPIYLKYSGAHTHRWSGGDKMNPQNFNRGGSLREALLAPPGHVLAVADSAQIEARVLPWLAGEAAVLDVFRRNDALGNDEHGNPRGDFYSDQGSRYFGKKLSKKETPIERQVAKSMELGLGFGMGWAKFSTSLLAGFLGAPPVRFGNEELRRFGADVYAFQDRPYWGEKTCGEVVRGLADAGARLQFGELLVHCAVVDHFVRLYRGTNTRIAATWKSMEALLGLMAPDDGPEVRGRFGCLTVVRHGLVKPNGMTLRYPGLRRGASGYTYMGWKDGRIQPVHIYGGLLTENVVQSLARDIVAEQALWIRADGYRIATTTHDEVVTVVPESDGPRALERMLARMKTPPAWCADLPLNATGAVARSYGDCK